MNILDNNIAKTARETASEAVKPLILLNKKQISLLDKAAVSKYGIPGIILMENAALKTVNKAEEILADTSHNPSCQVKNDNFPKTVVLFAGSGNNGGDALAAARHLFYRGYDVKVVLVFPEKEFGSDAAVFYNICKKSGLPMYCYNKCIVPQKFAVPDKADCPAANCDEPGKVAYSSSKCAVPDKADCSAANCDEPGKSELSADNTIKPCAVCAGNCNKLLNLEDIEVMLQTCHLIIDGIFGTGFSVRKLMTGVSQIIRCINLSGKAILSIDIPSGLDADTGAIADECITASHTVTFEYIKPGLMTRHGPDKRGILYIADIGIPPEALYKTGEDANTFVKSAQKGYIYTSLRPRRKESNKGDYGKILIITGSTGMAGAGCLCAKAALFGGAGLVYLAVPKSLHEIYTLAVPEAVVLPLEDKNGGLYENSLQSLIPYIEKVDIVAAGPGMGTSGETALFIKALLLRCEKNLILDADALNLISAYNIPFKPKCPECMGKVTGCNNRQVLITPHPGEMSRLTGKSIQNIQNNRINEAVSYAVNNKISVLLKGSGTVIASAEGQAFVNPTGNPGMATAGSGDVLTGLCASIAATQNSLYKAGIIAAYIHGLAGDLACETTGMDSLTASGILEHIPKAIRQIRNYNASVENFPVIG